MHDYSSLVQPIITIQFLIILGSLSHKNPPLNIKFPTILILLISYNITFNISHPHMIEFRVSKPHKNKITNKQIMKGCVCNNAKKRVHASRATVWKDDTIFRVNIYNGRNGCEFIISSPIIRRPKAFQ
jgi:hypothetical protein